jgi:hypothetical protein
MSAPDLFTRVLGPRPELVLAIDDGVVVAITVNGRRPDIVIHDYEARAGDPNALIDFDHLSFVRVRWRLAPWQLGLVLTPASLIQSQGIKPHVPA